MENVQHNFTKNLYRFKNVKYRPTDRLIKLNLEPLEMRKLLACDSLVVYQILHKYVSVECYNEFIIDNVTKN